MREAMAELPSATRQVRIYLHPDDASLVREAYADHDAEERPWKIIDDMALSRGGCRLESQTSRIDASVEKRLNSVLASLMGGTRASDHDEEPDDDETQA
jgi:flagellar assembly protein FliH